jgi:KTSC domain
MRRRPVQSSNLASVGYDSRRRVLEVEFLESGLVYQYSGVPKSAYEELMSAASLGRYFNKFIRDGGYPYRQVR